MKIYKSLQLFVFLLSIMIISCIDNRDPFYTKKGGWDYQRIPLIKPYFLSNTGNGWSLGKPDEEIKGLNIGIADATQIQVKDSIILFYSTKEIISDKYYDITWGFVIVALQIEAVFSDEQKYLDSLRHYTNITPTYRNIDSVWEQYSETGYLEWFPDEYKPKK